MWITLSTETILTAIVSVALTIGSTWILYPAWLASAADTIEWKEKVLNTKRSQNRKEKVLLSLVIPAYNEEDRIPDMMRETQHFLRSNKAKNVRNILKKCAKKAGYDEAESIEWIIVNDGSTDNTGSVVDRVFGSFTSNDTGKLLSLRKNSGKGAAIKTGMSVATGHFRLMVDADGATDFGNGLQSLVEKMDKTMQTSMTNNDNRNMSIFGSRAHLQEESTIQRSLIRTLLMHAFHFFVTLLVSSNIRDTQCGFKLFTKDAALRVFDNLHLRRWAFDTEIVLLCQDQLIKIVEVPVPWQEIDGSKLNTSKLALAITSITMLRDMVCVRACYTLKIWRVSTKK